MNRQKLIFVLTTYFAFAYSQDNDEGFLEAARTFQTTDTDFSHTSFSRRPVIRPEPIKPTLPPNELTCVGQPECAPVFMDKFHLPDGSCNNRVDRNRGRTNQNFKRFLPPAYGDGRGTPRQGKHNQQLPPSRLVSNTMSGFVSEESTISSQLLPFWGQFLDHDISFTPHVTEDINGDTVECSCTNPSAECFNIPIPRDDIQYKREKKNCFEFFRSLSVAKGGELGCDTTVRRQTNRLTAFIDLGVLYGNSEAYVNDLMGPQSEIGELRELQRGYHGRRSGLLPLQTEISNQTIADDIDCPEIQRPVNEPCFVSGDIRVNENSALVSQHTFWMKQHNKVVRRLHVINPTWDRVRLFQTARQIVTALFQKITYEHFLPIVVGTENMRRFRLYTLTKGYSYGYDSSYDATVSNPFTTAAFRMGHSLIGSALIRPSPDWRGHEASDIRLKDSFFNNEPIFDRDSGSINSILRGLVSTVGQKGDATITNDLRNFLFAEENKFGNDLFSLNIQRGRDHGLPGYIQYRKFCGLYYPRNFDDLRDISPENREKLKDLYRSVEDIDLFVGGLAEERIENAVIGKTLACLIAYQFRDIKQGDRLWHENGGPFKSFTKDQLHSIQSTTYPGVLCEGIENMLTIQPYPMQQVSSSNRRLPCTSYQGLDLTPWQDNYVPASSNDDSEGDFEWTVWFPATFKSGPKLSSDELLSYLLQHRPNHVCHQVLDTETRQINGGLQVRYKCPPGSIRHSDFPPVLSEDYVWTDWTDVSRPQVLNKYDDEETRSKSRIDCAYPFAIQVQTNSGVPAGETGEVFESFSATAGFVCRGIHQTSNRCSNYMVRYLCRRNIDNSINDDSDGWTDWISLDTEDNYGDVELLIRAKKQFSICNKPLKIEARTADRRKLPPTKAGDRIRRMRPDYGFLCLNADQGRRRCNNYEVRYFCPPDASSKISRYNLPETIQLRAKQMCLLHKVCCA